MFGLIINLDVFTCMPLMRCRSGWKLGFMHCDEESLTFRSGPICQTLEQNAISFINHGCRFIKQGIAYLYMACTQHCTNDLLKGRDCARLDSTATQSSQPAQCAVLPIMLILLGVAATSKFVECNTWEPYFMLILSNRITKGLDSTSRC